MPARLSEAIRYGTRRISDLHSPLATFKLTMTSSSQIPRSLAHFVDRRVVQQPSDKTDGTNRTKKCFVCNKIGCLSTNQSTKKRLQLYRKTRKLGNSWHLLASQTMNQKTVRNKLQIQLRI